MRATAPLTRHRIIDAAIDFIDESSLTHLSMKRLGERLEVDAMSLHRYVPGKENLLAAVAEKIMNEMATDACVFLTPTNGWQHFLQHLAHGVRRVALRHPNAFPLLASPSAGAPGLRAPLRSPYWAEVFLAALISEGFSDQHAMAAYRAFSSFLLGHLLAEVAPNSEHMTSYLLKSRDEQQQRTLPSPYPTLERLHGRLCRTGTASLEFEESLEALLSLLALQRSKQTPAI